MEPPRLWMNSVSKRFVAGVAGCRAEVRALEQVSLVANAGEIVTIVGGRGAGKTTVIHCAAGLLRPDGGEVHWEGRPAPPSSGLRLISGHDQRLNVRLALRALTRGPPRLLLVDGAVDEMDACDVDEVAERLFRLAADGAAILVTSRRPSVAGQFGANCLRLDRGAVRVEMAAACCVDRSVARVAEVPRTSVDSAFRLP